MRYTCGEIDAQASEGPVLQDAHSAHALAEDAGDLLCGEARDDPQQDHVPLVIAQRAESLGPIDARRTVERRVGGGRVADGLLTGTLRRVAVVAAPLVDQAVVGDEEDPGAEAGLVTLEALDPPDELEEDLAGEIVGIGSALCSEVAAEGARDRGDEALPRPVGAGARRGEDLREGVADRHPRVIGPWP